MMDFEKLKKEVLNAPINNVKMTDLPITGIYGIDTFERDGKEEYALICQSSKKRTPVRPNALAAMRIVTDKAKATLVKNTRDARNADGYTNLQTAIAQENSKFDGNTRFEVVHRLNVLNPVNDKPFFKNEHYSGHPAYVKAARAAIDKLTGNDLTNALADAQEILRATNLKAGVTDEEKNWLQMPVFIATGI